MGAAFGSYGWSGEAISRIEEALSEAKIKVVAKGVKSKWQPDEIALSHCRQLGEELAKDVVE